MGPVKITNIWDIMGTTMYVDAIEKVAAFTRSIHSISRNYGSSHIIPGAATIFFVNAEGWAITCAHVARLLPAADEMGKKYHDFKRELAASRGEKRILEVLEKKYGYSNRTSIELRNRFFNCIKGGSLSLDVTFHEKYDIALLKFSNYDELLVESFPIFRRDTSDLKQGKSLCRLGFPFPEFRNFIYNSDTDSLEWTNTGRQDTPRFPIDGMVTRHLRDDTGTIVGFEMSTPGIRGQSGGPAFDVDGKIWGMQSQTGHLDLDFDVDQEVIRNGMPKRVSDSAFLHVGKCIHVDLLKDFMRSKGVQFTEE